MANTHTEPRPVKEQLMEALADFQSGRTKVVGNCVKKSKAIALAEATATSNPTTKFPEERKHKLLIFKEKTKVAIFPRIATSALFTTLFTIFPPSQAATLGKGGITKNEY